MITTAVSASASKNHARLFRLRQILPQAKICL
jgi:hypothetical protein